MTTLVAIVIFGIGFALFATQNTNLVTVRAGGFVWLIPVYVLAFISLLTGLLVSWIINLFESLFASIALSGKENKIKQTEKSLENLHLRIHELELENERLKSENKIVIEQREPGEAKIKHEQPSLIERLKHTFSY